MKFHVDVSRDNSDTLQGLQINFVVLLYNRMTLHCRFDLPLLLQPMSILRSAVVLLSLFERFKEGRNLSYNGTTAGN